MALVVASPWLWITIILFSLINMIDAGPRAFTLPFLADETLRADVKVLGLFNSSLAIGPVLGAVWLGRCTRLRRRGPVAYAATAAFGLMLGFAGLPIPTYAIAAALFFHGLASSVFGLIWTNTLQKLVPADKLGRVSSLDALGSFALLPIGYGLAGWATDALGPPMVLLIGGRLTALMAGLGLLRPSIRSLD